MAKPDKKKKVKGFKEFDGSKYINTEPMLDEAKKGTVVIAWGRMNPMTAGHEKLVNKVMNVAKAEKGIPHIFLTHSQGAKSKSGKGAVNKDPLSYDDKIKFAQKAFGPVVKKSPAKTIIQLFKLLEKQFNKVVLVVGSDRVTEFNQTMTKYNGKEYNFDDIKIVSAGQRDADADDVSGISGTKMREYAKTDMKKFTANLPKKLKSDAEKIAALVNKGTQMTEESDLSEALSRQQRRKRALAMKKARFKIARGREKAKRKTASTDVLKKRARKAAINILKTKFSKSRRYADMSAGEKEVIDKRIEKVSKQRIDAIAKKLLPKVKQAERERRLNLAKGGSSKQEEVNETTGQYYTGVAKDKKDDREAHFKRNAKKSDNDASAYKPAPGDKEAKTKESKHTKKARAMGYVEELVWEDLVEGLDEAMWGQRISKKPHMLMDKNNKVKFDKRFKMYKPKVQEDFDISEINDLASSTEEFITEETKMRNFSQFIKEDWVCGQCNCDPCTCGGESLDEDAAGKSLADKAKKANMPTSVLRQVYNRGVAAWKTGHRPGTTPEQWGHARVNSFITKSKGTWGKADKDLADKVRKEEVELDEAATPQMMKAAKAIEAYAKKHGGIDKADFMKAAKMLSSGNAGTNFVKFVDDLDTDPREWLITNLSKTMGKQTVEKMFKVKIREEVEQLDELTAAEKKLINQMYDKKGNLTPMGKKVMDHGKANSKLTPKNRDADNARRKEYNAYQKSKRNEEIESIEEKAGLWANIHAKRARGEKMRKKGDPGAPTPEAIKRAQESIDDIESNLKMVNEVCGAGEQGTPQLTKKYKKDTPMESVPPEIVGAALAAPMVAQGAKAAAKGAYKVAKKIIARKKAKK